MDQQQPLEKKDTRILMEMIYLDISKFEGGLYPSSEMYEEIVDSILWTYPYFTKLGDLSLQSIRSYWKSKLIFKFGNSRKRQDSSLPEVVVKKRKRNEESTKDDHGGVLTWGLKNYSPQESVGEDEESTKAHIQWLKREYNKSDPDMSLVDMKMALTFPARRKQILDGEKFEEILATFPWLKSHRQLMKEFSRLGPEVENGDLDDLIHGSLEKYMDAIIRIVKDRKLPHNLQELFEWIKVQRSESQRAYSSKCCAIYAIAVLLKEKSDRIIFNGDVTGEDIPKINMVVKSGILAIEKDAFCINLEGSCLLTCDTFMEMISGLIATIYTFNLVYPKVWEKTLTFIQNILLGLKDGERIDKRIVSTFLEIKKNM